MAKRSWTSEQRELQAEAIRKHKPWLHSTGPQSMEGKAVVSRNAFLGGQRQRLRAEGKRFNAMLRAHRDMLVDLTAGRGVKP